MLSESLRAVVSQVLVRGREGARRVCACEVLINTFAARNLIRENKTFQLHSLMQTASNLGMVTMEQSLKELALKGRISREDAIDISGNVNLFASENQRGPAR